MANSIDTDQMPQSFQRPICPDTKVYYDNTFVFVFLLSSWKDKKNTVIKKTYYLRRLNLTDIQNLSRFSVQT